MAEIDVTKIVQEGRYLFLMTFAGAALRTMAEAADRIAAIRQFVDGVHARCGFLPTSGKYDLITIFDGDENQAYTFYLYLRSRPQFDAVDMLKFAADSPQQYLALIEPLRRAP